MMYILTEDGAVFHPGYYLFEIMHDRKMSVGQLANAIKVSQKEISDILSGKADIDKDLADKFYRYFGTSTAYWLNLQKEYDKKCRQIREQNIPYKIIRW